MKSLSIILLGLILFAGCDSSSDLSLNTSEDKDGSSLMKLTCSQFIPLPDKSQLWRDSVFTISKEIDGSVGGRIIMEKYYIAENGDSIVIKADLRIPAGAFQGSEVITMTVDDENAYVHFFPSMIFNDTLRLFQSFEGLHLENYQTGTIDFVYIKDDGTIELIKRNGLQIVLPQGIVRVQNAKLLHFSRYGWIRKPEQLNYPVIDID